MINEESKGNRDHQGAYLSDEKNLDLILNKTRMNFDERMACENFHENFLLHRMLTLILSWSLCNLKLLGTDLEKIVLILE